MSKILLGLIPAKKMVSLTPESLETMIKETCIAEFIHVLLCVFALPCLWIWPGWGSAAFIVLYILGNLPFIMIQRYNRPRLRRLWVRMSRKRRE